MRYDLKKVILCTHALYMAKHVTKLGQLSIIKGFKIINRIPKVSSDENAVSE